jgi:hypothetical protein
MFGSLMSGLVNTEKITHDTIQSTLEDVAEELGCSHTDFFIMIKPVNDTYTMKFWIYKIETGKAPALVREITLKEILNTDG